MRKGSRQVVLFTIALFMAAQVAWAAPEPLTAQIGQVKTVQSAVKNMRYSQTQQNVRIVFDVTALPEFTANLAENPDQLTIDFEGTINKVAVPKLSFNDPFVSSVKLAEAGGGKQRVTIDLKGLVSYNIFTLTNPNRVVVDIIKNSDQKREEQIVPGVKRISLLRHTQAGMVSSHVLDISPYAGYIVKPVLSNDSIAGLERLQSMAERTKAIAAVNASYFSSAGEIIGLLKIDGEIISTCPYGRTALGIMPDGTVIMDQVDYKGSVDLPNGGVVAITGINHERGPDDLILYNSHYGSMTGTNTFGSDYLIKDDIVIGIAHSSSAIPIGGFVLSAHGIMEKVMADVKVGDTVKVTQTLGGEWDKTIHAIGAGPRLIRDGSILLTSKEEKFPADITIGRAPRTAVGVTQDGHIILLVVDGRQQQSIGMTLQELALSMQQLGAVNAMNLDGGGSSEMVIGGKIRNKPSDGRERSMGDALILVPQN